MRTLLLATAFCLFTVPAFAVDPWAGTVVAQNGTDATGGATVVARENNSGFGNPFANNGVAALEGADDNAAALNAIAPAAGDEAGADDAAAIEPAAGVETPVTEDSGEAVEIAPEDKGNDIVGP